MAAESELAAAASFLLPVLHRESIVKARGQSVLERLDCHDVQKPAEGSSARTRVVEKSLSLFLNIHYALCRTSHAQKSPTPLQDSKNRKIVDGLLDLISLEGIYPSLSPGVGIPIERRVRTVLQGGVITRTLSEEGDEEPRNKLLLTKIVDSLGTIPESNEVGLRLALQERTLVDLIAGLSELAYSPLYQDGHSSADHAAALKRLLDGTTTKVLFPILTSLVQPCTPTWLRTKLSAFLSLLPLRPNGVQSTIWFLASTVSPGPYDPQMTGSDHTTGPALSLEVLAQASKLLVSVPSSMAADTYFMAIAPQLLQLLDDREPEMKRAAAYIIGTGILARRKYGSPGTNGWKVFAQPILDAFNPQMEENPVEIVKKTRAVDGLPEIVVSEVSLKKAVDCLSSLVLLHPNPGLTKRLVAPSLLALWALLCYARETERSTWADEIYQVLCIYFKTAAGVERMTLLADELLWDGEAWWTYGPGPNGGAEIRRRSNIALEPHEMTSMMERINRNVDELMQLLRSQAVDGDDINNMFMHVSKHWLLHDKIKSGSDSLLSNAESTDPLRSLIYARITQQILSEYHDKIAVNPSRFVGLVDQLLAAFVEEHKEVVRNKLKASRPSVASLSGIVTVTPDKNGLPNYVEEDPTEIVSAALSLLSAILISSELSFTDTAIIMLENLRASLTYLVSSHVNLPTSLTMAASNVTALLNVHKCLSKSISDTAPIPSDPYDVDRKTHRLAMTYVVDILPPIRAQGLSLLTALIKKSSPVLDIPTTTLLLLSILQDDEEFIYLSAIKAISSLANRHSRTVTKMLVERYVDSLEDNGLDVRIRVGEALLQTVEDMGAMLTGETAKLVGEGMIAVAGRRGKRIRGLEARQRRLHQEEIVKKESEEAWGGEFPELGKEEADQELNQRLAEVVEGWEGSNGEDDVRIRTSALSILGVAIETNIAGIGTMIVSTAIDLAIAVLKLEVTTEKAILRRAAALVLLSLLKALDAADEEGRRVGFEFAGENLAEVVTVLGYIEATDSDDLAVGHIKAVIESLEAWQAKTNIRVLQSGADSGPTLVLDGQRLGGLSLNTEVATASRPRIEELE